MNKDKNLDLYRFEENNIFSKFYKFIWNVDPSKKFKGFCPYFWSYLATILLLPIILPLSLIIKLLGLKAHLLSDFIDKMKEAKRKREINLLMSSLKKLESDKDKYIWYKKYKKLYNYHLYNSSELNELFNSVDPREGYFTYEWELTKLEKEYQSKLSERKNYIKNRFSPTNNKVVKFTLFTLLTLLTLILAYCVYYLIYQISIAITFNELLYGIKNTLMAILIIGLIVGIMALLYKLGEVIESKIEDMNLDPKLKSFVDYISNGIKLVKDILYNLYKNNCPIITWVSKEESNGKK